MLAVVLPSNGMEPHKMIRPLLLASLCVAALAEARPYRAMVTRTAATEPQGTFEIGLRYQGFFLGEGLPGSLDAIPWHQVAAHGRVGLLDSLELETQVEVLLEQERADLVTAHLGDIPVGLQWTFLDRPSVALGLYGRLTFPTGPSNVDVLPPTISDGTWDVEGTLLGEVRFTRNVRLMLNAGYLHHGVRDRGNRPDFDVPDAIRYDAALTVNAAKWFLFGVEFVGRSFFERRITPVWTDQQHLIEAIPGIRVETLPKLVIEAAVGVALTRELQQIYWLRPLLGVTYEF